LIKDIIPKNSTVVLYGQPGCGKTFIVLSVALSISTGHEWVGRKTTQGSDSVERIKRETKASVLLIHHTGKTGSAERGSSALRGAADVMIACSGGAGFVELKCDKMKDSEKFPDAKLGLLKITLANGRSSLAVAHEWEAVLNNPVASNEHADSAFSILAAKFAEHGATNAQWEKAFREQTGKSESTFNRAIKDLGDRVRIEGNGQGKRYFPIPTEPKAGTSVTPVSNRSHDTPQTGVISPPSLGGDTDTKAEDELLVAATGTGLPNSTGTEHAT
jgi:hypothetical protein